MDEHCRLCSKTGRPLVNIFSETGVKHKLTEKISQRLQLFVSEDDFLPKNICCNCCGKLDIFDEFVISVHKTQKDLQKRATGLLKGKQLIKNEVIDTIEIDDDDLHGNEGGHHVSVIRYPTLQLCNTDETKLFNISSTNCEEMIRKDCDETNNDKAMNGGLNVLVSSESKMNSSDESDSNVDDSDVNVSIVNKRGRKRNKSIVGKTPYAVRRLETNLKFSAIRKMGAERRLRSNPKYCFFRRNISKKKHLTNNFNNFDDGKPIERKSPAEPKQSTSTKKDFGTQNGNTLLSDLKALKNSLLLRKLDVKNAAVLTIPFHTLTNANSAKSPSIDSTTNKGCQTEILLGARSKRIVYQKVSLDGKSFLDLIESNAMTSSNLSA